MPESSRENQELQLWLVEEWAGRMAQAIESMTGVAPEFKCEPVGSIAELANADHVWWQQPFSVPGEAVLWAGGARLSWEEIGRRVLAAAGIDNGSPENAKGTFQELLNQSLSGLAKGLSSRLRKDIFCLGGEENRPPESAGADYGFTVVLIFDDTEVLLYVVFTAELIKCLMSSPEKPESSERKPAANADKKDGNLSPGFQPSFDSRSAGAELHAGAVDLLMDVELPVSISFGRAHLPLKDVVKLTTGSIVELNRTVSEPVEVIVNNCVIARGQVVVVEGNFGIRIDQVISRQERLRTLK